MDKMTFNEDSSASGHDEPWIQWFCGLKGHEMFCEVERSYIEDGFNLYGLRACVPSFSDCLDLMLDRIGPDDSDDSHLTQSACTLYGLIHARYIITAHGLDAMYNKYAAKEFGTCPLLQCNGQPVLPVGIKDEVGVDTVKVFCPKCQCVYHPPPIRSRGGSWTVDGASFGTTFPHLFLMTFSNLVPDGLSSDSVYIPRVFGFRVHQSARQRNGTSNLVASSTPPPPSLPPETLNSKGNHKTGKTTTTTSTTTAQPQQASEKKEAVTLGVEADEISTRAAASVDAGERGNQGKSNEKDPGQEDQTPLITPLVNCKMEVASKGNALGTCAMDNQNVNMGKINTNQTKRKLKISSGGGSISYAQSESNGNGKANTENGECLLRSKAKRPKRPGNGVT